MTQIITVGLFCGLMGFWLGWGIQHAKAKRILNKIHQKLIEFQGSQHSVDAFTQLFTEIVNGRAYYDREQ